MTSRRVKIIILCSWIPNVLFVVVELSASYISPHVNGTADAVKGRCVIEGLRALEIIEVSWCC